MDRQAQTWHYGIVARYWQEFQTEPGPELGFFRSIIEQSGEPVLDVGCGTGRLLLPLLEAGLDVDGSDVSPDMLAGCRERAESRGLSPQLYAQASHQLELPRIYRTIFVCGSFGIGGAWEHDMEALHHYFRLLAPGGVVAIDVHLDDELPYLNKELRDGLPEPWPPHGPLEERRDLSDGSQIELATRVVAFDAWELVTSVEMRGTLWRDGELENEETHLLKLRPYFKSEMLLMMERAGFTDVTVGTGYTGEPAKSGDDIVVFTGTRV